jgi:hypothetical protein
MHEEELEKFNKELGRIRSLLNSEPAICHFSLGDFEQDSKSKFASGAVALKLNLPLVEGEPLIVVKRRVLDNLHAIRYTVDEKIKTMELDQ